MSATVIDASNENITVAYGGAETIDGAYDVINVGDDATVTVNGYDDTINANYGALTVDDNGGYGNTLNASFEAIAIPINSHVTIDGDHDTIADAGHGYINFTGAAGSVETLSGTVLEITIPAGFHFQFTGFQNDLYLGANCVVTVAGDCDNLWGSDDHFYLSGSNGGGDEIEGSNDQAVLTGQDSQLLLYGDDELVHCGVGTSLAAMTGKGDRLIGAGFYVLTTHSTDLQVGGNGQTGAADTLTGSNMTATIIAASNAILSGDDDIVTVRLDSDVYFVGQGLSMHLGWDASLTIAGAGESSALDTITGADCHVGIDSAANVAFQLFNSTAVVGNDVNLTVSKSGNAIVALGNDRIDILSGLANQITIGVDDLITDGGKWTVFDVTNWIGTTTLDNFAADPHAVVDFQNGVGGFASSAAAAASLTSDGAGGLKLWLGSGGTLDFAGDTGLTAANFKIG